MWRNVCHRKTALLPGLKLVFWSTGIPRNLCLHAVQSLTGKGTAQSRALCDLVGGRAGGNAEENRTPRVHGSPRRTFAHTSSSLWGRSSSEAEGFREESSAQAGSTNRGPSLSLHVAGGGGLKEARHCSDPTFMQICKSKAAHMAPHSRASAAAVRAPAGMGGRAAACCGE